jgi:hypothetical protein
MRLVGVIEISAGLLVLTRFRRQAAYVVSAWLAAITGNLLAQGRYLDVAARDALLSLSPRSRSRAWKKRGGPHRSTGRAASQPCFTPRRRPPKDCPDLRSDLSR